ncbi:formate dehydrogenase accessory sulfurtransferase FdhD [Luteimonas granuli]|uniref:Uncharacterized protein n=1 Tax=Luteimonas granuli TaxID=1176533 RepID=A0A518N0S2_9GAMM|nr:hypothetical protein FPZ22_00045 [Luteimonas granuli]
MRVGTAALRAASADCTGRRRSRRSPARCTRRAGRRLTGRLLLAREDVGRHNALDKLIGPMHAGGYDPAAGFLVVTSRAELRDGDEWPRAPARLHGGDLGTHGAGDLGGARQPDPGGIRAGTDRRSIRTGTGSWRSRTHPGGHGRCRHR